ncbi:MAG: DUF3078 domain-containing protein [Mucinivorans sp.]
MHKFLILIALLLPICASGQFSTKLDTKRGETVADSSALEAARAIKPKVPESLNFTLYSDAYDRYVRRELFKQRNKIEIKAGLHITQTAFDNWASGGNNNFVGRTFAFVKHTYTKNNFKIVSTFDGAFSMTATDEYFRKTEDYLNMSSTPSWKISNRWELSGSAILKTQFGNSFQAPGDTMLVSSFFAPATLNLSAGITYSQPKSLLEIYFAPISGQLLMVLNKELSDKGGFGVEAGKRFSPQVGALMRIKYGIEFAKKKIAYNTTLETFWRYDRNTPTLWWENNIAFKFTNLLWANLYVLAIYNDQIKTPRAESEGNFWQIKESFGFGLTFNFNSKVNSGPVKSDITKARNKRHKR